ncbi:M81 family metallopeptidase, partial [Intestinibacillus massiliensis]|nr:M81 family metallopeptidase [Intestinibacillus massiliensis]
MTVHDLHANVSPAMIQTVNGLFGYNTQPHADMYEREQEAAALMGRTLKGEVKTYCTYAQPPLLLPAISTDTAIGAMKPVIEKAFQYEEENGIINVSPFAGYYGSDTVNTGASAVVVAQADKEQRANEIAAEMADYFW